MVHDNADKLNTDDNDDSYYQNDEFEDIPANESFTNVNRNILKNSNTIGTEKSGATSHSTSHSIGARTGKPYSTMSRFNSLLESTPNTSPKQRFGSTSTHFKEDR
jgi:hypothetical protein